jgi:hypothetical protein
MDDDVESESDRSQDLALEIEKPPAPTPIGESPIKDASKSLKFI